MASQLIIPCLEFLDAWFLHPHELHIGQNFSHEPECVSLGYQSGVKGYKLYDIQSKQIFLS